MPQPPISGLQAQLDTLRAQTIAIAEYYERLEGSGVFSGFTGRLDEPVSRSVVEGWREARDMLLDATRALTGAQLRELDEHLRQRCGTSLDDLQERRLKRLSHLREKGQLTTDEQWRFVEIRIDEIQGDPSRQAELRDLTKLVADYELVVERRLNRKNRKAAS